MQKTWLICFISLKNLTPGSRYMDAFYKTIITQCTSIFLHHFKIDLIYPIPISCDNAVHVCLLRIIHMAIPEFTPGFSGVRVTRSLVLCVCFVDRCFLLLYVFFLAIVLFVLLWYTDSDCPFGIFKFVLQNKAIFFPHWIQFIPFHVFCYWS